MQTNSPNFVDILSDPNDDCNKGVVAFMVRKVTVSRHHYDYASTRPIFMLFSFATAKAEVSDIMMLTSSLSKAARKHAIPCLSCSVSGSYVTQAAQINPSRPPSPRSHQRRQSSSKTSNPPSDDSRPMATPSETPTKDTSSAAKEAGAKRPATRLKRQKSKNASQDTIAETKDDVRFRLPSVPSTQHLHPHGTGENPPQY